MTCTVRKVKVNRPSVDCTHVLYAGCGRTGQVFDLYSQDRSPNSTTRLARLTVGDHENVTERERQRRLEQLNRRRVVTALPMIALRHHAYLRPPLSGHCWH